MPVQDTLARLRRSLARIEAGGWPDAASTPRFTLGLATVDEALGGGLPRAALHEVYAGDMADGAAAMGFALALTMRASAPGRMIVWVQQMMATREQGAPYPPGIAAFGLDPARLLLVRARDGAQALRAAHEALRCSGLGGVVLELWGAVKALDLTASRRLARTAASSGVSLMLMRSNAEPVPSAAFSRWLVRAGPSVRLAANAPGAPAFEVELLRHRAGVPPQRFHLEWDRDAGTFREPAQLGAVVSLPVHRPAAAERRRAS